VTLWTPYPVLADPGAGDDGEPGVRAARVTGSLQERQAAPTGPQDAFTVTDEMIASLLAGPSSPPQRSRRHLLPLIPLVHGFGALTTFLLTVTAALLPVR